MDALQRLLDRLATLTHCPGCGRRYDDGIPCYGVDPSRERANYTSLWCERRGAIYSDGTQVT